MEHNVTFDDLLSITENTIAMSSNVLSHTDTALTIYMGAITFLTVGLTIGIQIWLARDKQQEIKKAISNILESISKDNNMRDNLIKAIISDDDFKQKFNEFIDLSVNDKVDFIFDDAMTKKLEEADINKETGELI
jgi:uncharacterized oligopeptide transporter (OPT) family protein